MNPDPIAQLRRTAWVYLILGILVVAVGLRYKVHFCLIPLLVGVVAYLFLSRALANLLGASQLDRERLREFQQAFQAQFSRHALPRQIFWLLFAVAEADGATEEEERDMVRRFLLERFTDPATAMDLRAWEAQRIAPDQVGALALGVGRILTASERETVFSWCCLVAFADDSFNPEEHIALQQIARSFGLEPHHARRIFHWARDAHASGSAQGYAGAQGSGGAGGAGRAGRPLGRSHAFRVLGLEEGADPSEIRKRHRELVRKFHPDRHQHLGDVAAKEAEERFREIQAAYELLSA